MLSYIVLCYLSSARGMNRYQHIVREAQGNAGTCIPSRGGSGNTPSHFIFRNP